MDRTSDVEDEGPLGSLASISEGAGLFVVGSGVRRVLGLVTNVVLTRLLGTAGYGVYAYLVVVLSLLEVVSRLGADKSVLRFLPEYGDDPGRRRAALALAYGTSLGVSLAVAAGVYLLAPTIARLTLDEPLFVDVLRVAAVVLPFNTLGSVVRAVFRAVDRMEYDVAVSSVAAPLLRLVFVGGGVVLGYAVVGAAAGLVVAGVLALVVAVVLLARRTDVEAPARPTRAAAGEYLDFALPVTFTQLGNFLYNRVDLLMVGLLLSGSAVGIYNVAVLVSGLLALPLRAFNQLFPPVASRLYHDGEHAELASVYATVTRWTFTVALLPALGAALYAEELLLVFGEGFPRGGLVLVLFVLAQLTNCAVGPSGYVLMMADRQYLTLFNQVASGLCNAVLNYVFILEFGFLGAAVATATVLAGVNVLRVVEVWYLEGMVPYDRSFLKPLAAAGVAGLVMHAASLVLASYALVVGGGLAGTVAFAGTLSVLGVGREETELFRHVVG